jgi:hypothetical protein
MKTRWGMGKRSIAVLLWSVAAVVAVSAGVAAVSFASGDGGRDVLSRQDVDRALDAPPADTSPSATSASAGSASTSAPAAAPVSGQAITTSVGAFVVSCDGGRPTLLRCTQKSGYRVDDDARFEGDTLRLEFESDVRADVTVEISCVDRHPQAQLTAQADDHGGHDVVQVTERRAGSSLGGGPARLCAAAGRRR